MNNKIMTFLTAAVTALSAIPMTVSASWSSDVRGDVNGDYELTVADAVAMQKWLMYGEKMEQQFNADMNNDGCIDTFDYVMLTQELFFDMKPIMTVWEFLKLAVNETVDWSDFEEYRSYSIGKDNVMLKYPVGSYGNFLYISGDDTEHPPKEIYLVGKEGKRTEFSDIQQLLWERYPENKYHDKFAFDSPDGSQTFYVEQTATQYKSGRSTLNLTFYTDFDHYNELEYLELEFPDKLCMPFSTEDEHEVIWNESTVTFNFTADKDYSFTFDLIDTAPHWQTLTYELNDKTKPEITSVELSAECAGDLQYKAKIGDMYNIDVFVSGTVGLVGAPVKFECKGIENATAVLHYNEDELRWVREENLVLFVYDAKLQRYGQMPCEIDTDSNTVTFEMDSDFVNLTYLLVDSEEWFNYKWEDTREYRRIVNALAYPSDWERGYNTGDIMNLCDKSWAMKNAPDFKVSTAEELASVVWYVNASGFDCTVTLENDIDLEGLDWRPMGYLVNSFVHSKFHGTIDGQGHNIKNMTVSSDMQYCGFVGFGSGTIKDINFENANVRGYFYDGIAAGRLDGYVENVRTQGNINWSGKPDSKISNAGPIVGSGAAELTNCTSDVTLNGEEWDNNTNIQ